MITSFEELTSLAREGPPSRMVVAGADAPATLEAVVAAQQQGFIDSAVLVDSSSDLPRRLDEIGTSAQYLDLVRCDEESQIAARAVEITADTQDVVLLKGRISTSDLLGAVLQRGTGLRTERVLSDLLLTENPVGDQPRLVAVADGGVNIAPDLMTKKQIIENAVSVLHRLGWERPKVALLCAVEKVSSAMPHTREAQLLTQMNDDGQIQGCVVDGPLALDNALCPMAARAKGIESPVAGQADILIAPTIEAGNILGKSFRYLANRPLAHVIEGARVPILIPSRTESRDDKLLSIALGAVCCH